MKIIATIIVVILLLFAFFPSAFSQDRPMSMTAHAIRIDNSQWILCNPPVIIAFKMPLMLVLSKTPQEYIALKIAREQSIKKGDGETSTTWLCRDADKNYVYVTLGFIKTDTLGLYFSVEYPKSHTWIYRGYPNEFERELK